MKIRHFILWVCICISGLSADELDLPVLKESWREEVLNSINWDYPGLEKAKKLFLAKDKKGASAEFVKYLRKKKQPKIIADILQKYSSQGAKDGLNYTWRQRKNVYTFPNKRIDWHYNMTAKIPGMYDDEWQWQLNRMHWFNDMAAMYLKTKNPAYPQTFVRQLRSWAVSCPMPAKRENVRGSTWRTIECGLRLSRFWAGAYTAFIKAPEFTDDDVIMYCYLSLIQRRFLVKNNTTANIFIMEMHGIYTFSAMFPEFKDAEFSRKYAVRMLTERIGSMLLPDGFLNELTNSYHNSVVGNMFTVCKIARDCGFASEIPQSFIAPLERSFDAQMALMTPAFDMPLSNDTVHARLWDNFQNATEFFPHRKEFQWVRTLRKKGKKPEFLSKVLPWAGFAALRESWEPEANYLCFDIGALGMWHFHQDKLNITIWKGQDQLLYDDGGGSYAHSKFRQYARSSNGHNLVLVDGLGQLRTWEDMKNRQPQGGYTGDFTTDGKTDYVRGEYDLHWEKEGNRICRHERQIVFIRPRVFVVLDRLIPINAGKDKPHTYQARWHVDTTKLLPALKGHPAVVTTHHTSAGARERVRKNPADRAKLIVAPLFTKNLKSYSATNKLDGKWNELAGFYAAHPHRPTTTILHEKAGKGEQRFLTLFIPLGAKEKNPLVSISQAGNNKAEVRFNDGKTLFVNIINGKLSAAIR